MLKRFSAFFALVIVVSASNAYAQEDYSKVEIKASKVAGNVYMLEGRGGNIGVSVGSDGILIVDDQFAPLADKIKAALKTLGEGKSFLTLIGIAITQAAMWSLSRSSHYRPR